MSETDLQKLVTAAEEACNAYAMDVRTQDSINRLVDVMGQLRELLDAHADNPDWFPVTFEVGGWIDTADGPAQVLEVGNGGCVGEAWDGTITDRYRFDCIIKLNAVSLGVALRGLTTKELGQFILRITANREHFKP